MYWEIHHVIPVNPVCWSSQSCLRLMTCHLHKGNLPKGVIMLFEVTTQQTLILLCFFLVSCQVVFWSQNGRRRGVFYQSRLHQTPEARRLRQGPKQMYHPATAAAPPSPHIACHCCQQLELTHSNGRRRCCGGGGECVCVCWMWCVPHGHTFQVRCPPPHHRHHQPPPLPPPQTSREKQALQWQRHFQLFSHKEPVCKASLGAWKSQNGLSLSSFLIQRYF